MRTMLYPYYEGRTPRMKTEDPKSDSFMTCPDRAPLDDPPNFIHAETLHRSNRELHSDDYRPHETNVTSSRTAAMRRAAQRSESIGEVGHTFFKPKLQFFLFILSNFKFSQTFLIGNFTTK